MELSILFVIIIAFIKLIRKKAVHIFLPTLALQQRRNFYRFVLRVLQVLKPLYKMATQDRLAVNPTANLPSDDSNGMTTTLTSSFKNTGTQETTYRYRPTARKVN